MLSKIRKSLVIVDGELEYRGAKWYGNPNLAFHVLLRPLKFKRNIYNLLVASSDCPDQNTKGQAAKKISVGSELQFTTRRTKIGHSVDGKNSISIT